MELRTPARMQARQASQTRAMLLSPLMSDAELGHAAVRVAAPLMRAKLARERQFESVGNVRDLGGLPALTADGRPGRVRFNRLWRSAHLDEVSPEDAAYLLESLGVKTWVDLRNPPHGHGGGGGNQPASTTTTATTTTSVVNVGGSTGSTGHLHASFRLVEATELHARPSSDHPDRLRAFIPTMSREGNRALAMARMRAHHKLMAALAHLLTGLISFVRRLLSALPIPGLARVAAMLEAMERQLTKYVMMLGVRAVSSVPLSELYAHILLTETRAVRDALLAVSDAKNHPAIFHCQFGKDRTGVVAALVLHGLGVPRDVILHDYHLSTHHVESERGKQEWARQLEMSRGALPAAWNGAPLEALRDALAIVEKQHGGSLDAYLETRLGLQVDVWRRSLRDALVEPAADAATEDVVVRVQRTLDVDVDVSARQAA